MSTQYDAIIIGGGHNGLVTAAMLAQAGQSVLVLEKRPVLGGASATEEIFPGFKVNTGASDAGLFRPEIISALNLSEHGLEFLDSSVLAFAPQPDGRALTLWQDVAQSQVEIARFSERDAENFPAYVAALKFITAKLDGLMTQTPPNLNDDALDQFLPWFQQAFGLNTLTQHDMTHFLRVLPMSVAHFLDDWFESEALKGLLASRGILGNRFGPQALGTAFEFFYQHLGNSASGFPASHFVKGGIGQLSAALASSARQNGAEIRTGAEVAEIILSDDRATGVKLASGETLSARIIVSNADPRHTLFGLVGVPHLEMRVMRRVRNIRFKGVTAKINLALSGLLDFPAAQSKIQNPKPKIIISPSLNYLERAADAAKYGQFSRQPYLEIVIPTLLDPSLAPAGQHIANITMQYAPYQLKDSSWDEEREALGDTVIDLLSQYAPNLKDLILHRQIITPLDWERDYGLSEGSIYHGEMGLDQLFFMRPIAGFGQYQSPVENLYLCGAGAHPGGGVSGAPGFNAAREILRGLG